MKEFSKDQIAALSNLVADVQPGVLRKELNRQAGKQGLFFPPDPGADASIGGMIANNASTVQTVKYGATKDYDLMRQIKELIDPEGLLNPGKIFM
jgi:FAD/FMN-containing dehydrogenase